MIFIGVFIVGFTFGIVSGIALCLWLLRENEKYKKRAFEAYLELHPCTEGKKCVGCDIDFDHIWCIAEGMLEGILSRLYHLKANLPLTVSKPDYARKEVQKMIDYLESLKESI